MIRSTLFRILASLTLALLLISGAHAQEQSPAESFLELAVDPSAVMTIPLGTLESIRGSEPCSRAYVAAPSVNLGILLRVGYIVDDSLESGGFRVRGFHLAAGYDDISSRYESSDGSFDAYDPVNARYTTVATQHRADFSLHYLRLAATVDLAIGGYLILRTGPNFSAPLSGKSSESESILSPSNATFLDRTQDRTFDEGTGDLSDLGARFGIGVSLIYRLPLGRKLFFEPNIGVDLGLTTVQPSWSPLLVRGGISIGYKFLSDPVSVPPDTMIVREDPRPVDIPFTAQTSIDVAARDLPIEFRRQIIARFVPLLPTIFFQTNAAILPERYVQLASPGSAPRGGEAPSFDESQVPTDAERAHHQTLNIFAKRLLEDPSAKVTITGTTSRDEENRAALAQARAQGIADYFTTTWGIARNRITVRARIDPEVPSNSDYAEGLEENRRVELDFSDDEIYRPIEIRSVEPITEPREIPFRLASQSSLTIDRWLVEINVEGKPAGTIADRGVPPSIVSWKLTREDRERVLASGDVTYALTVFDSVGRSVTTQPKTLPVRLDTTVTVATSADRPVNTAEFLLVTFDFDRADLTRRGRKELQAVLDRVGPESEVTIVGYTDRVGDAEHNRALAQARAQKVADAMPAGTKVEARGAAPEEAPYGSRTPEGRFLSRTVRVVIRNPK